jgi:hypothetical protein
MPGASVEVGLIAACDGEWRIIVLVEPGVDEVPASGGDVTDERDGSATVAGANGRAAPRSW